VAVTRIRALALDRNPLEEGKGTTFVMRLPVTLAIVRALIAGVGTERYRYAHLRVGNWWSSAFQATTIVEGREAIVLRDRVVPLVHLRRLLA